MTPVQLSKAISFGIVAGVLVGFLFLIDAGLEAGFAYGGEAFLKGYGHLLQEHWGKGLLFVSLINFVPALLLTYLFFLFLDPPDRRAAFGVTWLLRAGGILLGYALVNLNIEEKLNNRKYVR